MTYVLLAIPKLFLYGFSAVEFSLRCSRIFQENKMKRTFTKRVKLEKDVFVRGQIVFIKLKGWPPWPSRIEVIHGSKYDVYYFGTHEM